MENPKSFRHPKPSIEDPTNIDREIAPVEGFEFRILRQLQVRPGRGRSLLIMRPFFVEGRLRTLGPVLSFLLVISAGCHQAQRESNMLDPQQTEKAIAGLRAAYAAFNRGDIDAAVQLFDPNVEWSEPPEFPGGGTYHGVIGAKRYLSQSRAGAA